MCEKTAAILQANILRVLPTVAIQRRVGILGSLGPRLKTAVDLMLLDPFRDPATDPGLAQLILLYASIKDILLPDFSQQFSLAGDLLSRSISHGGLSAGQRSLGAALMHELSSSNLIDVLRFASPDTLIEALLSLLDSSLEKDVRMLAIGRNCDEPIVANPSEQEERAKQLTSFNRIIMHTSGTLREEVLKSEDEAVSNAALQKYVELTRTLVLTAKKHIEVGRSDPSFDDLLEVTFVIFFYQSTR